MKMINPERYQRLVNEAQAAEFSGWDFNWLDGRMVQDDTPWDYQSLVKNNFSKTQNLLDMGTGGGELLASLAPLPPDTHATEAYPPNQAIARERLSPLGVKVHNVDENLPLPFSNARFDLVINRHESFEPYDLHRILKPNGIFITQQVGGLDNLEINQILEDDLPYPFSQWGLASALTRLYEACFLINRSEKAALTTIFLDIGAVVYYLKAIKWQVEGFSASSHLERLVQIHNIIELEGRFITTAHRFLIVGQKKTQQQ